MTGEMLTWMLACVDEDEWVARSASGDPVFDGTGIVSGLAYNPPLPSLVLPSTSATHIARQGPAATLRRIEADRRILERHQPVEVWAGHEHIPAGQPGARELLWLNCSHCIEDTSGGEGAAYDCRHSNRRWPCPDILDLASRYAGQPGWRDEWTVTT